MEGIITCNVCTKQFDNFVCIPRILECGHTFCSPCLIKITESCPTCPKCRSVVSGSVSSFPINYSNLEAVEIHQSKNRSKKEILTSIRIVESNCIHRRDILALKKSKIMSSFDVVDNCLERLKNLTLPDGQEVNPQATKKVLNEIIEDLKKTDDVVRLHDIKSFVSFFLENFQNSGDYLAEIYKRVENDEKVFAVHKIDDKLRYGKVVWNVNQLLFHSLTLTEVPKDASLIWFDELKRCTNFTNFCSFIKITCNKNATRVIAIKMLNKERSHHFVKLCTGEYGPTYKGASFCQGYDEDDYDILSIMRVSHFIENECEVSRVVDYNFCDESLDSVECKENHMYLSLHNKKGGFNIFVANKTKSFKNIVGKVITPTNLCGIVDYVDSSILNIVDCGIILEV